jgi:hypothetical protein
LDSSLDVPVYWQEKSAIPTESNQNALLERSSAGFERKVATVVRLLICERAVKHICQKAN